jgi:DNA-binding transcriptional LysR family regulator
MIDQILAANGLQACDLPGYAHEEFTHDAVAAAVASGKADVGIAIRAAAARYDLGYVPLGSGSLLPGGACGHRPQRQQLPISSGAFAARPSSRD